MGSVCSCFIKCCCGETKTEEQRQKLALLERINKYDLLISSLPVFMAAGINNFVSAVIEAISDDSEDPEKTTVVLSALYAIIIYFLCQLTIYGLRSLLISFNAMKNSNKKAAINAGNQGSVHEDYNLQPSKHDNLLSTRTYNIINYMKERRLLGFIERLMIENVAFAWKEFLLLFIVEIFYSESGFGPSIGLYAIVIVIINILTVAAVFLYRNVFKFTATELTQDADIARYNIRHELVLFQAEAFSLAMAAVLVELLLQGCDPIGCKFARNSNALNGFEESEGDDANFNGGSLGYIFFLLIGFIVAFLLFFEDVVLGIKDRAEEEEEEEEKEEEELNNSSEINNPSIGQRKVVKVQSLSEDVFDAVTSLRHTFYGCLFGVTFFLMLTDNFMLVAGKTPLAEVCCAFIIALLIHWRAPKFLASKALDQEEAAEKIRQIQQAREESGHSNNSIKCLTLISECYSGYKIQRRGSMMIAMQLTVGWMWETFVLLFFRLVASGTDPSPAGLASIALVGMIVILLIGFGWHQYSLKWGMKVKEEEKAAKLKEIKMQVNLNLSTSADPNNQSIVVQNPIH